MTGELEYGSMAKDRSLEYDRNSHAPVNSRLRTEANPSHCMSGWWPWETKELSQSNVVLAMVQLLPVSRFASGRTKSLRKRVIIYFQLRDRLTLIRRHSDEFA